MMLLRLISWPYVRKHLLRSVLTTLGIVLGVAVFVGMHLANRSVLAAFNQTVGRIAGKTQLQVSAGEPGFPEEALEKVQALEQVAAAVPVIEAPVETGLAGQGNLLILAVDMTGDRSLRDYDLENRDEDVVEDPLVFLAQPDSLIVSREFAKRNHLAINSRISMRTMEGPRQFTVRGIMGSEGLGSAFGGNLAVMDIYAAQVMFGRGRRFDRIDIAVAEKFSLDHAAAAIRRALGPGYQVDTPSSRGRQFESLLRVYQMMMNITSLFALFIGMFLIYNSFAIAVTQRRAEIGTLRALGATRAQIRNLFLVEGAIAGAFGSALGLALGLGLARGMAGFNSRLMQQIYGVSESAREIAASPLLLAGALAIGILTSVAAAVIPARGAARVDPVQALQKGKYQVLSAGENRVRRRLASLMILGSALCLIAGRSGIPFYAGYILAVAAVLLLTPTLALWLTRALRPLLKFIWPVEGALAADSLLQAPRRTSSTVAAVMLSIALVVGLAGLSRASYASIEEWLTTTLNPDFYVSASSTLVARAFRFPYETIEPLRAVAGVDEVQPVRSARMLFRGGPVMLVAIDIERIGARTPRRRPVAGDFQTMNRLAGQGKGLIISENLYRLERLKLGEMLEVPSPSGIVRLPIVGVLRDYSDQQGAIFIDRSLYLKYWKDPSVDVFRVYVKPGARPDDVRRRILDQVGGQRRLFVLSNQEVRDYVLGLTDQWFAVTYMQLAVAILIAVLGIVNTLTVSIADRRRELGILRAVGGLASQIRRTIRIEAASIALTGTVLGLALGALNLYYNLEMTRRDFSGMGLEYRYPYPMVAGLVPLMLAAGVLAALWPARAASRGSLVEALEYE